MSLLLIAVIAGAFSVLTPCILPVLPALLVVSEGQGRARIIGLVSGVVVSFCAAILFLTAIIDALGIPDNALRYLAAAMMLVFGLVLIVPRLDHAFQRSMQVIVRRSPAQAQGNGLVPGFLAGATLGIVWAPCAGPILGGITSLIAREGIGREALIATTGYGLGMVLPLTAVVFGGRRLVGRLRRVTGNGRRVNLAMGVVLVATSALFISGLDTSLNRTIASTLPFTSTPVASLERDGFDSGSKSRAANSCAKAERVVADRAQLLEDGYPETGSLCDLGPAPSLEDLGPWINTADGKPLTSADLKGKVVLVDFWTYSCINCIRTLPHLRAWDKRYRDAGLVIVGAHTPEFGFEQDLGNVRAAVKDLDVTWPVAQDNDYATWKAFGNRYWPAKYLIDRDGTVRVVHYGEGEYEETEEFIRELLGVERSAGRAAAQVEAKPQTATPEIYLGYSRAANFVGRGAKPDAMATYTAPAQLALNEWTFTGRWKLGAERSMAGPGATLRLRYAAREAYLVMSPPVGRASASVVPVVDGTPRAPITVDGNRLYTVASDAEFGEHALELQIPSGVAVYAFTFG